MRFSNLRATGVGLATMATVVVFMACKDTPTEPGADNGAREVTLDKEKDETKAKGLHFARVRPGSAPNLVDGTAVTATRVGTGHFLVTFASPISGCAGAANTAEFPGTGFFGGFSPLVARIFIGLEGFGINPESVLVVTFDSTDGDPVDAAFTLILVCP